MVSNAPAKKPVAADVQACFDFIVGISDRELMRVDEIVARFGVERTFVYELIDEGKLETHRRKGLARTTYLVTRRSVLAWLADSADYSPEDFVTTLADLAKTLTRAQRAQLAERILSGK